MVISRIEASKTEIKITVSGSEKELADRLKSPFTFRTLAFVPQINAGGTGAKYPGRCVFEAVLNENEVEVSGDTLILTLERNAGYDLLICRFEVYLCFGEPGREEKLSGVSYVNAFAPLFSECTNKGPEQGWPVGTWLIAPDEDIEYMHFGCMMDEIDLAWILSLGKEGDIVHEWNGRQYYFDRSIVELHDRFLSKLARKGIPCLIRFINRDGYQNKNADGRLFEILKHPCYEAGGKDVEISGFNLRTEEGVNYYCACLDFILSRYSNPESPYGWSTIIDIGNEVNAAGTWYNSGPMLMEDLEEEYSVALRLAWQIARKYHSDYQVHVSVEHNFAGTDNPDRRYFYPARDFLLKLAEYTRRDGDFDWGVSTHPYPENLLYPDFYNDRIPVFSFDTRKITLKNMEVWPAFLSRPEVSYEGRQRRVLFDEQGFNTRTGVPYTEEQGAYAFVLAYLKFMQADGIDYLLIHRHVDLQDSDEYGLHLGLRYAGPGGYLDDEHIFPEPGRRKLICHAIAAMTTDAEELWVRRARSYIGEALFDELMNVPEIDPGSMGAAK